VFEVPAPDFELSVANGSADLGAGPQIVLCVDGKVTVGAGEQSVPLMPGSAAFVAAGVHAAVTGQGTVFRGRPKI
jgi:mannose-6-phosphate isomerase class I